MNILFDINHPAHVHLFRNTINILKEKGHDITIVARDKDVTLDLLDHYGFEYVTLSKARVGLLGLAIELIIRQIKLIPIIIRKRIHICISLTGASSIHIMRLFGIPYLVFTDSENNKLQNAITVPFANEVYTPSCYKKNYGKKHHKYAGYHELAYLHPNYFTPNQNIYQELGLENEDTFFILRFVAWQASHDVGHHGFSFEQKQKIISYLSNFGKVFITSEKSLEEKFEPYRIKLSSDRLHDALFYASMLISESQTVTTESALLGTPAIRFNSRVCEDDEGNFIELEKTYDLLYSYNNFNQAFEKMKSLLENKNLKQEWQEKRKRLLEDKTDVTQIMVNAILHYDKEDSQQQASGKD